MKTVESDLMQGGFFAHGDPDVVQTEQLRLLLRSQRAVVASWFGCVFMYCKIV